MNRRRERQQQFDLARKYTLILLAVIFLAGITVTLNGISAKAGDLHAGKTPAQAPAQSSSYKSILLEQGDTLWGIALEYRDSRYGSTRDYIDEVMEINDLTSDRIHAGSYLAVPYYE